MAQGLALGITVGSSNTVAVTTSGGDGHPHGTAVYIRPSAPGSENLLSRVGDPVGILTDDGTSIAAADPVAGVIGRMVDDLAPASTVACHPAWWPAHAVAAQRAALDRAGHRDVTLVPEPTAALRWLADTHGLPDADAVVVYDLGATGVTVSVLGTGSRSGLLGEPLRSTDVAGAEFDLLTMRYVLANAAGENDFDPFDPMIETELSALRRRCGNAKEELSGNTAAVVPVRLPGIIRDIRLVRDEVEDLFRGPLLHSLELVHEALRRAGSARPGRILLTGGGAAIPLLAELISSEFGVPVLADSEPAHTSAHGASALAADLLDTTQFADAAQTTTSLAAVVKSAAPEPIPAPERTPILPPLPQQKRADRVGTWRRVAFIGGAAVAVAVLATGTLALGTAIQSSPTPNSSEPTTATPTPGTSTAGAGPTSGGFTAVSNTGTAQGDRATTAPISGTTADTPAPVSTSGSDPQAPAADSRPDTPVPNTPAPQPGSPPPAPAVQPPPVQPPSAPTLPSQPGSGLGNTLNNGLGQAGDALGTVLQAPGQVLPHTGG
ncbi:Hsp70 family protein [Nocardia transvalensis]|uniref:Hsp70 family protein n=1 Tax=Nocardia transvalensis TaxID=37333 RepID=UPI001893E4B6|nr:Hsp70 family protein [Nocardia transvalensis]MBF6329029.1 Hsp70 family protein [Nocardia transvalensis]